MKKLNEGNVLPTLKAPSQNQGKEEESKVIGQLDKSAKMDEKDTVTFGLETDDGKIVKVYVDADQANDFENALSSKLGEVDDIEAALNDLAKDFDIVDVEWPDDNADDEDEDADDNEETGSDAMNDKVYNNDKEKTSKTIKPKMEGKHRFKDQMNLLEDNSSIESRMTSPTQLMVYHALIELGMPEIAINKSPYKSTIIQSIKHRALDINKTATLKAALKMFVQRAHGLDEKDEKKKHVHESMEQLLAESLAEDFWNNITKIIMYFAPAAKQANDLIASTKFKTLISRSSQSIPQVIGSNSELRMKIEKLSDALDANDPKIAAMQNTKNVTESVTPDIATTMFANLFSLVDPTSTKSISTNLINSPEFKQYFTSIKTGLPEKFSGNLSQKFVDFCNALNKAAAENKPVPSQPGQNGTAPATGTTPTNESVQKILKEAIEWEFGMDGDIATVTTEGLKMSLDLEQLEKAIKAINSKSVVVVKDSEDPKLKYTFSPRGINLVVKKLGENTSYQMNSDQIQDFMSLVTVDPKDAE
jgi:hypothetical protein